MKEWNGDCVKPMIGGWTPKVERNCISLRVQRLDEIFSAHKTLSEHLECDIRRFDLQLTIAVN